jgi:hypothetical protein
VPKILKLLKQSVSLDIPKDVFKSLSLNDSLRVKALRSISFNIPQMSLPNVNQNADVRSPLSKIQQALAGTAIRNTQPQQQLVAKVSGRDLLFVVRQEEGSSRRNFGR